MSAANDVEHLVGRLSTLIFWKIPRLINTRSLLNSFQYLVPILLLLRLHHLNRTTLSENPDMFATDISIAALNSIFSLNTSLSFRTSRSNLAALQQPTVSFFRVSAVRCQIAFAVLREALCAQRSIHRRAFQRPVELLVRIFVNLPN